MAFEKARESVENCLNQEEEGEAQLFEFLVNDKVKDDACYTIFDSLIK